jgi:hypothetical protein
VGDSVTGSASNILESGPGEYPHPITVDNTLQRTRRVTITVERNGTVLYREAHDVPAQTERIVAGFTRETLQRNQSVSLTVETADGQKKTTSLEISACLGEIQIFFDQSETIRLTYAIC